MRLLYFVGKYGEGYMANHIHGEFVRQLSGLGHHCTIASLAKAGNRSSHVTDAPLELEYLQVNASPTDVLAGRASKSLFAYDYLLAGAARLRTLIRRTVRPDLIYADMAYPYGAMASLACLGTEIPLVVSVRGGDLINCPEAQYGYCRYAGARMLVRLTFGRAFAVRVNSPLMARMAIDRGCDPAKVRVVPPNVGVRPVQDPQALADLRRDRREAIFSGNWESALEI